jgi:hypothetical protein
MKGPDPLFLALVKRAKLPAPVAEHRFDPARRWRFDYAWVDQKVALEVEGGVWTNGRHTRGAGFLADVCKYNRAAVLGWRLLRCTPKGLHDIETITTLTHALTEAA